MAEFVRKKPFLLAIVMPLLGFIGTAGSLGGLLFLVILVFGNGPYMMNGDEVSKAEFLDFAIPFLVTYLLVSGLMLWTAWSIHSESPRSRPLLMLFVTAPAVALALAPVWGTLNGETVAALGFWALLVLGVWVYLYRRESVRSYYAGISNSEQHRP